MNLSNDTIDQLFIDTINDMMTSGQQTSPRGLRSSELRSVTLTLKRPRCRVLVNSARRFSLAYATGELLWYLSGRDDLETIRYYAPTYNRFSDDGQRLYGGYGPRLARGLQWRRTALKLRDDPASRQAVVAIYDSRDVLADTKDVPCTLSLQYLLRDDKLHAVTMMRSEDLWLGFPNDLFTFTVMQELVAAKLWKPLGTYTHFVSSLHCYETDWGKINAARNNPPRGFDQHTADWNCYPIAARGFKNVNDAITFLVEEEEVLRAVGETRQLRYGDLREVADGLSSRWTEIVEPQLPPNSLERELAAALYALAAFRRGTGLATQLEDQRPWASAFSNASIKSAVTLSKKKGEGRC